MALNRIVDRTGESGYPVKSVFMVVKLEEIDDIGASHPEASLTLVFEDGEAGNGEVNGGFEL